MLKAYFGISGDEDDEIKWWKWGMNMLLRCAGNFLFDYPSHSQTSFAPFWPCSVSQRLTSTGSIIGLR